MRSQIRNTLAEFTVLRWDCQKQQPEVFFKKTVLKKFTISTGNTRVRPLFKNVAGLKACKFIKKRLQHRCFLVNIAKFEYCFFRKTSANNCFLTFLMVHCYMGLKVRGLDCMTTSGFRV